MKKIILLVFCAACIGFPGHAQDNPDSTYFTRVQENAKAGSAAVNKRFGYFFTIGSGVLIGCSECSLRKEIAFTTTTVHGVTIGKKLRAGLGVGYDAYYLWQFLPISATASWDLIGNKERNALFVQAGYGWSKAWSNGNGEYGFKETVGGPTATTQIGYRIRYHDSVIALSIGTKFQQVTTFYEYPSYYYTFFGGHTQGVSSTKSVATTLNRLQVNLTMGWR